MASKKDMRREDLIVRYMEPAPERKEQDMTSTIATTMPMVAIFLKNRMLGWTAVLFALQTWLAETPDQATGGSSSGFFSVGMAVMSLVTTYLPLFLPPPANNSRTGSAAPAPPA